MKILSGRERIIMNQKLRELVEFGADIEFCCRDKEYTILPWTNDGIVISEKNGEDHIFESYEDMINKYKIEDVLLKDILNEIEITFTSGC